MPDTSCIVRKATKAEINWKILKMCFKSSQNKKKKILAVIKQIFTSTKRIYKFTSTWMTDVIKVF